MQKQDRQAEAKAHTESGEEEAKGGEEMTREEVVQAALTVERWCSEHSSGVVGEDCDCPFCGGKYCALSRGEEPSWWYLEDYLRTRGLKDD